MASVDRIKTITRYEVTMESEDTAKDAKMMSPRSNTALLQLIEEGQMNATQCNRAAGDSSFRAYFESLNLEQTHLNVINRKNQNKGAVGARAKVGLLTTMRKKDDTRE